MSLADGGSAQHRDPGDHRLRRLRGRPLSAVQPGRGNWIIHEDGDGPDVGRNNDLWSCRDDGEDADTLSDGCVRIATLNDLNAEWTGGIFDATGTRFFVSVQHNVTGHGVILEITGWR